MKILIILASGIGNSIMFSPTLKALRKKYPRAVIDLFAYKNPFVEPFKDSKLVNNIFYYNGPKTILRLRKNKYDISITAFPSNKWQFNLFAFIVGARKRITHSYKTGFTLSFLQNTKIQANEKLHDVEQNLNLIKPLGIRTSDTKDLFFYISKENENFAEDFIKKNKIKDKKIIGVHPGSGPLEYKRAPLEKFIELINKNSNKNSVVLIFGGKEEEKIKQELKSKLNQRSLIISDNLKNTAALIIKCNIFITNDTGLMHIASTNKKTKVIALFNGTNPTRTSPWTKNKEVIILKENKLKYPFHSTNAREDG